MNKSKKKYVAVPAREIFAALERSGFEKSDSGDEVVYVRIHHRARELRPGCDLKVAVYTSVSAGAAQAGGAARGCGEDAIRALALFTWPKPGEGARGVKKIAAAKVLRVTSVEGIIERMLDAARKMYAACNEFAKKEIGPSRPGAGAR